jgi:hypothetical protein
MRGSPVTAYKLLLDRVSNFLIRPAQDSFQYRTVANVMINGPASLGFGAESLGDWHQPPTDRRQIPEERRPQLHAPKAQKKKARYGRPKPSLLDRRVIFHQQNDHELLTKYCFMARNERFLCSLRCLCSERLLIVNLISRNV